MVPIASPRRAASRSYTLIELIMVMAVLALAAALLIPNIAGSDVMKLQAAVRLLIADLSFAQSDALANQEFRRVVFYQDGSGYCIIVASEGYITPNDLQDPSVVYVYDPLRTMGRYVINYDLDDRFEGVSIINLAGQETVIDGTALAARPELTYDQLAGTVAPDGTAGIGGSITLSYKGDSYMVTIAPFTGKLTVIELPVP